jgi:hypothetical protein
MAAETTAAGFRRNRVQGPTWRAPYCKAGWIDAGSVPEEGGMLPI